MTQYYTTHVSDRKRGCQEHNRPRWPTPYAALSTILPSTLDLQALTIRNAMHNAASWSHNINIYRELDGRHSIEVQTYAGHSITFNMFLHFVTLWP